MPNNNLKLKECHHLREEEAKVEVEVRIGTDQKRGVTRAKRRANTEMKIQRHKNMNEIIFDKLKNAHFKIIS